MHHMLEGLASTLVHCVAALLKAKGVLADVNATFVNMNIRSHDPTIKFTWVRTGLQSLTYVSAQDMPGVLNSLVLTLGVYTRGTSLCLPDLLSVQRSLYLFGALHRNMKMPDHTEEELEDPTRLVCLFAGTYCCVVLRYVALQKVVCMCDAALGCVMLRCEQLHICVMLRYAALCCAKTYFSYTHAAIRCVTLRRAAWCCIMLQPRSWRLTKNTAACQGGESPVDSSTCMFLHTLWHKLSGSVTCLS
jgi:hypothetical protein